MLRDFVFLNSLEIACLAFDVIGSAFGFIGLDWHSDINTKSSPNLGTPIITLLFNVPELAC